MTVNAIKQNNIKADVYFFDYEDNLPINDGVRFCQAIEKKLNNSSFAPEKLKN